MEREGNIYVDEKVSLLEVKLPINGNLFRTEINTDLIPQEDIRVFLSRMRDLLVIEQKQDQEKVQIENPEELERLEKVREAHRRFALSCVESIFLSEATEIKDELEDEKGEILSKEFLLEWLEGDFIMAWARVFYFTLENNRVNLKKKLP